MARRTGTANLPLHGGKAPAWLFQRMATLGPAVIEVLVIERGPEEVLRRLSDPWWFQAFGCVLGFDWHSSGVTTTVCGALKAGLAGREADVGLWVAGGKGRHSRHTPEELLRTAADLALDGEGLVHASRMAAKVDSAAVQDGFELYHHSFFLTRAGRWAVVQQGMRDRDGSARRYHWLGERVEDFVCEPHAAVASDAGGGTVLNLVAAESGGVRSASAELARWEPERLVHEAERARNRLDSTPSAQGSLDLPSADSSLDMPRRHWVDPARDIDPRQLRKVMLSTYQAAPENFEELLAVRGVGAKTLRALALLAELTHGEVASVRDPARFSFAHGGKDGTPFPVDRATYDDTIAWLREAVDRAKVGHSERLHALRRLGRWEGARRSTLRPPLP
jgi:hypothetical protein